MKISKILATKPVSVSFEVFPPKESAKIAEVEETVKQMLLLKPDFMSVTYGAAGTSSGFTTEIAAEILRRGGVPLSHLTCLTSTKDKVDSVIREFKANGIENILALRGDIPKNFDGKSAEYFSHASALISEIKSQGDFCIGAACYPEKHPESTDARQDILHLKLKADAGADFFTTQMFFDNSVFYRFKDNCRAAGINSPIIAGIMPITNIKQIGRTVSLSGCTLPKEFSDMAAKCASDASEMKKAGIEYAINQIRNLIENGQKNIHIYTMNRPEVTEIVTDGIKDLI